ncbi:hypothetical protein ACFL3B_04335 [Gemmatimonadota bacterium]
MAKEKTPPKWAAPFFTICAILIAVSLVVVLVQGEREPWYQIVGQVGMTILCAWLARESWRKRKKEADPAQPQSE